MPVGSLSFRNEVLPHSPSSIGGWASRPSSLSSVPRLRTTVSRLDFMSPSSRIDVVETGARTTLG